MNRSYYSAPIPAFLNDTDDHILGVLTRQNSFATDPLQRNSWIYQIQLLRKELKVAGNTAGYIFFEFAIPRMGKRVDIVFVTHGIVFVIEFKVGDTVYARNAIDQVEDYGLDLKNFHSGSHDKPIVPILTATDAPSSDIRLSRNIDGLYEPLMTNGRTLVSTLASVWNQVREPEFDAEEWAQSAYKPTPTIIEAAQALYRGHSVTEISRHDAEEKNLSETAAAIDAVIQEAKSTNSKAICFITGVPGSGKTLAGLNIANERHDIDKGEHAVFLSGNGPLVNVLREALARNKVAQEKELGNKLKKTKARSDTEAFIQNIHHFRDDNLETEQAPVERVVVFDEAQRAWTKDKTTQFMKSRKGIPNFNKSEPEFLIEVMDRHDGYAVIICLVGGGQEINTGEAGLPEWFDALANRFENWSVHVSGTLHDYEYGQDEDLYRRLPGSRLNVEADLHLAVSVRSYRAEAVSDLVKQILDGNEDAARVYVEQISGDYPIVLTRNLDVARRWLRWKARGTERYGLVASSGALRLKPLGLNIKARIDPVTWFLNECDDVRSSYYLEDVASEFDVQGLELDWACVAWDANFLRGQDCWVYRKFSGTRWQSINDVYAQNYLKNAYRVLLTRARQGFVIFVPEGAATDPTRDPSTYDSIAHYLTGLGIKELTE